MSVVIFGQIVVGPPGSGKSTYCKYICENLKQLGRNAQIVNLDPANDCLPYKPAIDISELITVQKVMEERKLGPNGAMIHCMEVLSDEYEWLYDQIVDLIISEREQYERRTKEAEPKKDTEKEDSSNQCKPYLIIDCPGQTELFTHHTALRGTIKKLQKVTSHFDLRLVCLNLCDAFHASDLGKYIGLVMNSLITMINLELPHVNVLSKVDKMESYGKTRFNLDFYCEVPDLKYLLETELESPFYKRYRQMSLAMIGVIEDYSLVHFTPLNIQKSEDIYKVLQMADKANGYYINDLDLSILQVNPRFMEMASGKRLEPLKDATI